MSELDINGKIESQFEIQSLMQDLRHTIEQARGQVAATANYEQTMMYWHIGERINREVLENERAEYGKQIVSAVSTQITWSHVIEELYLRWLEQNEMEPDEKPHSVCYFAQRVARNRLNCCN